MCHNYFHFKTKKDYNIGTNYQLITLLLPIGKTREKTLVSYRYITENISDISRQHGFKDKHSTHIASCNICNQITKGFNNPKPPQHTVAIVLYMSKAYVTLKIHKLMLTNILNIIIKFIANYIKG